MKSSSIVVFGTFPSFNEKDTNGTQIKIDGEYISTYISSGDEHIVIVTSVGTSFAFGKNTSYQLGIGETTEFVEKFTPVQLQDRLLSVKCGNNFSIWKTTNNSYYIAGKGKSVNPTKINENYHNFAHMKYIRTDGLLSSYSPDFVVKINDNIYLVETKAQKDLDNVNVKQKQKSAVDWCKKVNELPLDNRMSSTWSYSLLDDNTFYSMKERGASTKDVLEYCKLTNAKIQGTLF